MDAVFEGIGASVRRKEDLRFISGRGNYTDDINRPGQLHAHIRRSDRPHAKIVSIDTAAAKAAPGVVGVFTAADMAALGGLPCGWQIHSKDGSPMAEPKHPVLAEGKVRHVGDPIAVVVAETQAAGARTPPSCSTSCWKTCPRSPPSATPWHPARRWCSTKSPATSASTGISGTRERWTRHSHAQRRS